MARTDYYNDPNAPTANSIVPAVSAVVYDEGNRIVLHRRTDNNLWSLLGGALEPGESIIDAISREVFEESGLRCSVERLVGIYSDPKHVIAYSDGEVRQQFSICFACRIVSGKIAVSDESKEVAFHTISEVQALDMHPSNYRRIQDYLSFQQMPFIR